MVKKESLSFMVDQAATLIVPIENQVREFDAKLLLGCVAAENGFPVILGSRSYVHYEIDSMPRGVYLAKSMRSLSDRMFSIMRSLGHEIVAFDEEGLLRPADDIYYERRLSEFAVQQVSALMAWGPDNADSFARCPAARGVPIHTTGNPRVDLLRPEVRPFYAEQVRRLQERYGGFILLNSNFGLLNHYIPAMRLDPTKKPVDEFEAKLTARRTAAYAQFCKMIPELADTFSDHTLLIRPHPVESHEPWLEMASGHSNIVIENEGSVIPWLMASEVVVQNGCQTAVEGALVGTPVINYQLEAREGADELIESLSHPVKNLSSLLETVRSILAGDLGFYDHPDRKSDLERHIAALEGPLASERIVDVLKERGFGTRSPSRPPVPQYLGGWVHNRLRTAYKRIKARKSENRNSQEYHDHRYPEVSIEDVRERISRFGQLLGRFEGVRVRHRSEHLFHLDA